MYHILCLKVLCDDKVESPLIHLLHSVVQMCTVGSWSPLSPSDSKSGEVAQLNATIGAVCGEYSSFHLSEPVRKVLLRAFSRHKGELRQSCLIFSECTVLNFQCHRLRELAGS